MVDLETECTSLLNPEYYSTKLKYYLGQQAKYKDADPKKGIQDIEVDLKKTF